MRVARPEGMTEEGWVGSWNERGPARERVEARFIDSRFANTKSFEDGGMVTLIEKFDEIGLTFWDSSTGGGKWTIEDGCEMIDDALAWDESQALSFFNEPKLFVSEECRNLIFALKTWTGEDGQSGATKDPIDCLRILFLKGVSFREEEGKRGSPGRGCY